METRARTNFASLESSCLLIKSGQLIPVPLFGASLFLAWLPSQINWFPVANLECSLCAMFFFPPFLNTQIPSFSPSTQRNKSKATLPSAAQLCMCVSFYTWKTVYFCFSSINARACLLPHQPSPDSWDATFLTGKSLTHTQNTPTDGLLLFFALSLVSLIFFFFGLFLGRRGMFRLFVVVFTTEIMVGSEVTNLSDCKDMFKYTQHCMLWRKKKVEQLDPGFLYECQGSRWSLMITAEDRCIAAGGSGACGEEKKLQCAVWQRQWE